MIAKSILRLEKEGIVYRKIDQEDKRIKRLYLTKMGRKLRACLNIPLSSA